jgi:hypothetical protein
VFIPSKILMITRSNTDEPTTNEYQLQTHVKFFKNLIPSDSVGDQNQEYTDSDYTQAPSLYNLQRSIGFMGDQSQISCNIIIGSESGPSSNPISLLKKYNGGYYDHPIASINKGNVLENLFTGYIYYKKTSEQA